jgi:hypothetical protein
MPQPPVQIQDTLNRFESCVSMNLHHELNAVTGSSGEVDLKITIRFGRQRLKVRDKHFLLGLRRGELHLEITNGKIPLDNVGLTAPFEREIEVEAQQERGDGVEVNVAMAGSLKTIDNSKTSDKVKYKRWRVPSGGSETSLSWFFNEIFECGLLEGLLSQERLGTIDSITKPCSVYVTFGVSRQSDLNIEEIEDVLEDVPAKTLSRNKERLKQREAYVRLIEKNMQPYLSRVRQSLS